METEADYILAIKQNQPFLFDDVQAAFVQTPAPVSYTSLEKEHGRIEQRTCIIITDTTWLCKAQNRKGIHSIVCIETGRTILAGGEKQRE